MASVKIAEVNHFKEEIEAKKAFIVYDDPLELENEVECATQAKEQKLKELHKNKEELGNTLLQKELLTEVINRLKGHSACLKALKL